MWRDACAWLADNPGMISPPPQGAGMILPSNDSPKTNRLPRSPKPPLCETPEALDAAPVVALMRRRFGVSEQLSLAKAPTFHSKTATETRRQRDRKSVV